MTVVCGETEENPYQSLITPCREPASGFWSIHSMENGSQLCADRNLHMNEHCCSVGLALSHASKAEYYGKGLRVNDYVY